MRPATSAPVARRRSRINLPKTSNLISQGQSGVLQVMQCQDRSQQVPAAEAMASRPSMLCNSPSAPECFCLQVHDLGDLPGLLLHAVMRFIFEMNHSGSKLAIVQKCCCQLVELRGSCLTTCRSSRPQVLGNCGVTSRYSMMKVVAVHHRLYVLVQRGLCCN